MVKVKEVAVGTMTHIKDMTSLVILLNKDNIYEEEYEALVATQGTTKFCDATVIVTSDTMTVNKDSINLMIPLSEANKYEVLQDVIYAELLQFLNSVALLYDKDGNQRYSGVSSWHNFAVNMLALMQEGQA